MLCPNHSSEEYKALEAAGLTTFEIYKYWADHDNTLGTPEEVRYYNLSDEEKQFLSDRASWTEEEMERMNEEGPPAEVNSEDIVDVIPKEESLFDESILTKANIGDPIDETAGTGICEGTCGLMTERLKKANMPYGYAHIDDKYANYHAVALTEIDGKRWILNQPQLEFMGRSYQNAPLWERALKWRGMSQRFNRHIGFLNQYVIGMDINNPAILTQKVDTEYGEVGPLLSNIKEIDRKGYKVITGEAADGVRVAIKLDPGQTLSNSSFYELNIKTTKAGEETIAWTNTKFKPRLIEATIDNLKEQYQLTDEQAARSIKEINKAKLTPAVQTAQQEPVRALAPLSHFKKAVGLTRTKVPGENLRKIKFARIKYNKQHGTDYEVSFKQVGQSNEFTHVITGGEVNLPGEQLSMFHRVVASDLLDPMERDKILSEDEAQELITALKRQFHDLQAFLITPEEAMLKTNQEWSGEPGFFGTDGNVYFVKGHLTTRIALHEFSHPIFRSMWNSKTQSVRDMFDKMYSDLSATSEGSEIIAKVTGLYKNLTPESNHFKEEVLVRALTRRAYDLRNDIKSSPGFINSIKKILYTIKQFLRKLFKSPISPENLNVNTTIDDLAKMLANNEFKIDRSLVSQEDITSFIKENNKMISELSGAKLQENIQPLLDRLYQVTYRKKITTIEDLPKMLYLVQDEFGGNLLEDIRREIWKYKDLITDKIDEMNNQSKAFFSALYQIEYLVKNMSEEVSDIKKSSRTKDDVARVQTISEFINEFDNFLNNDVAGAYTVLSGRLPQDSILIDLMDDINRRIKSIRHETDPIIKEGAEVLLGEITGDLDQRIEERYKTHIEKLKKKGIKSSVIKSIEAEYNELRGYPGKIKEMLSGLKGDAGALNTMLEGWLYSSDDVVGGMGVFFKNVYNSINNALQERLTDFVKQVVPLAEEAGITLGTSVRAFSKNFLTTRKKPVRVDGELQEHEVFEFINRYTGDWEWDKAVLKDKISNAREAFKKSADPADKIILDKLREEEKDLNRYFHREFVDEFYDKNSMFDDPIGQMALEARDDIWNQINELQRSAQKEGDLLDIRPGELISPAQEIEQLHRQLRQLYSLKDLNDQYKIDDPDNNKWDLSIAERLQHSREVNRSFYRYVPIPAMFQRLLSRYEQELIDSKIDPDSKEFADKRQQWLDANTVQAIKPEFYQRTNIIFQEIKAIYNSIPNPSKDSIELAQIHKDIRDTLSGYRDDDGQPIGVDMSPKTIAKIKSLQERADKLNKKLRNALTPEQAQIIESMEYQLASGQELTQKQQDLYDQLRDKLPSQEGLSQRQRIRLSALWKELSELQGKEPTEYYLDVFNNFLDKLPEDIKEKLISLNKTVSITKDSADFIINLPQGVLKDMLNSVDGFTEWFKANHYRREFWDSEQSKKRREWVRVASWSVTRPLDPEYMEHTEVADLNGNKISISGRPSLRFYRREVKPEFHTGYNERTGEIKPKVGEQIDIRGNWLPKTRSQGAPDDKKYINPEYFRIQQEEPARFKALEKIKELYLDFQSELDYHDKLGYDFPMIRKTTSEAIASGENPLTTYWSRVKAFFLKRPDDYDSGYNFEDEPLLASEGYFTPDKKIPVTGTFNLPIGDVSLDLFHGVAQYMGGAERHKQLKKILPFFKAIHSVLTDPANTIRTTDRVKKRGLFSRFGSKNKRADAIFNKMEREFYGQVNTGIFADNKGVNAVVNAAFKVASFSYLAVNIPASVANMFVQVVQNVIKSTSGEQFTFSELMRGSAMANTASIKIASEIHRNDIHSLDVQKCELFDPIPGQSAQKIGTSQGRSWVRDFASFSWLFSPRKYMENFATLQAFFAMMDHVRIKQTTPEGVIEINYDNAWYLKDGIITLKEGIDPVYDKGGREFNKILNYMQHIQHDMNGAYDSFSQPEAYRYLLYRMYAFLRKYVTTMLTNRFAGIRRSPGLMDIKEGFYTSTAKSLWRIIQDPKYIKNLSPLEQGAAKQFLTEIGLVTMMWFMYGLFGWDPDDEEKYAKLREKSGPLPLPFVPETEYPFQADGWLSNHMLLQLIKVKSQTEMWMPLPGLGLDNYTSLPSMTPIAVGPTIDIIAKMLDASLKLAAGDKRAYYQRTIGPYQWQQEGSPKLYNYIWQSFGLRGATITPELAIQKQEQARVLR